MGEMKYIIMCGGTTKCSFSDLPKPMVEVCGESLVVRTIRLLRENGIDDIAISSNDDGFEVYGVPVLHHTNYDVSDKRFRWLYAFYPMSSPVCYLFGDVFYSTKAIKTIIDTKTEDIEFFASARPFSQLYCKKYAEPFAFKVVNTEKFFKCIDKALQYYEEGRFQRHPISWELWQVIKNTRLNTIVFNYINIYDYTVDVDNVDTIKWLEYIKEKK